MTVVMMVVEAALVVVVVVMMMMMMMMIPDGFFQFVQQTQLRQCRHRLPAPPRRTAQRFPGYLYCSCLGDGGGCCRRRVCR